MTLTRRAALALTLPAVAVAALLTPALAQAGSTPTLDPAGAAALSDRLGDRSAGAYLDGDAIVVTVTDDAAARTAEDAGAVARHVTRGAGALAAVAADLRATAAIPGTAWAVRPAENLIVVTVDDTVTGAGLSAVEAAVARSGGAARLERVPGRLGTRISGGEAIYGGAYRCSLGFTVTDGVASYFLTAGHCTEVSEVWYADLDHTAQLGTVRGGSFPGDDYGIVRYSADDHPSAVDLYDGTTQEITSAGTAVAGQAVQRSGSTTGLHAGTVLEVDATVIYPEGTVSGLIRTDVCAEGGDSGGSLFAGPVALGLTSGGLGDCFTGGTTYFQPVDEVLAVYGVNIP
ncbi:S1 family peptidase [Catenuloplanes japonicus]